MGRDNRVKEVDCDCTLVDGMNTALKLKFSEMHDLSDEARSGKSAEAVHDMRVASRRLRSALQDFRPYLDRQSADSVIKQVKSIADALGEVRDQDVAILALEKLAAEIPPQCSATLEDLIDSRKEIRKEARKKLKHDLKEHLKTLRSSFRETLAAAMKAPASNSRQRLQGDMSYRDVAALVISNRLIELEKLGDSLDRPEDVDGLHQMRIAAKRLRYAIELLHQCWSPGLLQLAEQIARLQSALGNVHDCDVWIESFSQSLIEARKNKHSAETEAYTWFCNHFLKLRNKHLQDARSEWKVWDANNLRRKLTSN